MGRKGVNRRLFVARGLCAAASFPAISPASFPAFLPGQAAPSVAVAAHTGEPLAPVPAHFMGLGYEISSVAEAGLLTESDQAYVRLVRTLGTEGVLRIGGNTADYAHYQAAGVAQSAPKATRVNDQVLRALGTFVQATNWKLIWGLNLGSGSVDEAVQEAGAVLRVAGNRLLAFEIGNEPDLFPNERHRDAGWSYEAWLADYRRYKQALRAHYPGLPLAGPDVAGRTDWVTRFAADEGRDIVLLTHHYYRGGQASPSSTAEGLLGPDPKLQTQLDTLRAASARCGVPYRICEVNSFSGGGRPGVSDTLAGALWALDSMWTLAANGCSGINMETGINQLGFVSSYSPIGDDLHGAYAARPEYYGMLAFALGAKGRLLRVTTGPETGDGAGPLKAYAASDGHAVRVTLIHKGPGPRFVTVQLGGSSSHASVLRLAGPAVDAKTGITLGGSELGRDATFRPAAAASAPIHEGVVRMEMPGYSAAVIEAR